MAMQGRFGPLMALLLVAASCGGGAFEGPEGDVDSPPPEVSNGSNGQNGEDDGADEGPANGTPGTLEPPDIDILSIPGSDVNGGTADQEFQILVGEGCEAADLVLATRSEGEEILYDAAAYVCLGDIDMAGRLLDRLPPVLSSPSACAWYRAVEGAARGTAPSSVECASGDDGNGPATTDGVVSTTISGSSLPPTTAPEPETRAGVTAV